MNLLEPQVPEDFDEFWETTSQEAKTAPLDYHRSLTNDFALPGFIVETISFRGVKGDRLSGWLAYPPSARRLPAFVWTPPYGRESLLPNRYGTREGFCSLSFNFHGHDAFHQETYVQHRGYFAQGIEDPETWIFREMFQNAMIATRVLQAQTEAGEERIGAMGMSQGAGLSIWLGAHSPIINAVCADMPFLGGTRYILSRTAYRYPLKEIIDFAETIPMGMERILFTLSYFDTIHQATRCKVPTQISLGLKDPAVKPESAEAIFEALPNRRKLLRQYDVGHDWYPDMVENNRRWLLENL